MRNAECAKDVQHSVGAGRWVTPSHDPIPGFHPPEGNRRRRTGRRTDQIEYEET